jgi:hypothetical protein
MILQLRAMISYSARRIERADFVIESDDFVAWASLPQLRERPDGAYVAVLPSRPRWRKRPDGAWSFHISDATYARPRHPEAMQRGGKATTRQSEQSGCLRVDDSPPGTTWLPFPSRGRDTPTRIVADRSTLS